MLKGRIRPVRTPMKIDPVIFAQNLIRCPSVTPADGGALDVLEGALHSLGFNCKRLIFKEKGTASIDNLYAQWGEGSPHFCFAGHTDVVPSGDLAQWDFDPFGACIKEEVLYGRGAVDMKGALASFVSAVAAFLEENTFLREGGSISLLITGDEEGAAINGTQKILRWLKEKNIQIDACLIGEPTSASFLGDQLKIGRRGSLSCWLTAHGMQGHVAYPQNADNPIPVLMRCLQALLQGPSEPENLHFPPSHLEILSVDVGNSVTNVIPSMAKAMVNIRYNNAHTASSLEDWIRKVCAHHLKSYELVFHRHGEAYFTPPGKFCDQVIRAIHEETGQKPFLSTSGGTSDGRFIQHYAPVVELGLMGQTMHQVNEHVAIQDLNRLARIYHRILCLFFQTREPDLGPSCI